MSISQLRCDYLSGEYWFQRELIEDFQAEAQCTGTRIVLAAGVDTTVYRSRPHWNDEVRFVMQGFPIRMVLPWDRFK